MGRPHVVHDLLEGLALLDVQPVTCLVVGVPVVYHDTGGWRSGDIAAPLLLAERGQGTVRAAIWDERVSEAQLTSWLAGWPGWLALPVLFRFRSPTQS